MTHAKISSDIIAHEISVLFLAFNNDNPFPDFQPGDISWTNIDGTEEYDFIETDKSDIFFNFMKPEDTIYETGKAVSFSLQVTDDENILNESIELNNRLKLHIMTIKIKNKQYDSFQIAEDYEFSADYSNIIQLSEPSQKEFLNVFVYADKKEDATSIEIIGHI